MGRRDTVRSRVGRLDPPQQNYAFQPDRRHDRVAVGCLRGLKSFLEEKRGRKASRKTLMRSGAAILSGIIITFVPLD